MHFRWTDIQPPLRWTDARPSRLMWTGHKLSSPHPSPFSNHPHNTAEGSLYPDATCHSYIVEAYLNPYGYYIPALSKMELRALYGSQAQQGDTGCRHSTTVLPQEDIWFLSMPLWTSPFLDLSKLLVIYHKFTCKNMSSFYSHGCSKWKPHSVTLVRWLNNNSIQRFLCNHTRISKHTNKQSETVSQLLMHRCSTISLCLCWSLGRNNHTNLSTVWIVVE